MQLNVAHDKVVVVSDLHLGCPSSSAGRDFARFLDEVEASGWALCINGDGFDLLQSSLAGLATDGFPVLGRLQDLAREGTVVRYVLGNHDLALEHILLDLRFQVSPFLNLTSGAARIRIEHGHLHEPFYARFPGVYELGGRLARAALLVRADAYELWARAQQRVDDRRRGRGAPYPHHAAALDLFRRGFDAVVFGHTHQPERTELPGGLFVNGGDWLRRRTIVTIDEGRITLGEWEPGALAA
ncbi:MAG: metallophosphoesterase [Actinomycetota bacterium]|nr:metallophosphoesterase [Actinomycetota bacterium]